MVITMPSCNLTTKKELFKKKRHDVLHNVRYCSIEKGRFVQIYATTININIIRRRKPTHQSQLDAPNNEDIISSLNRLPCVN